MRMKSSMVMVLLVVGIASVASVASAATTYYEGFDYTVGTQNLNGQGPWGPQAVSAHADFDVYSGSPSYTDGDGDVLVTSGNHVGKRDDFDGIFRTDTSNRPLSPAVQALFGVTQTIYMAGIFGHGRGSMSLRGGNGHVAMELVQNSANLNTRIRSSGGPGSAPPVFGPVINNGTTAFWGLKIDNVAGGNETYTILIDPDLSDPNWGAPDLTSGPLVDLGIPSELFLDAWAADPTGIPGTEHFGGIFDEIRIGTSWPDVALVDPTDFIWTKNELGSWTDTSSWNPQSVPNNANHTATFGSAATGTTVAVVHSAVTVNRLTFDNTNQYIVAGGGSVNLAATTADPLVNPAIDVISGNHQFQALVNLLDDTTANIASGSTLSFNNELSLLGNTLTKTGAGTLAINNQLTTAGGTVILQEGTISGGGTIGGNVNNDGGTISPGDSLGAQTVVPEPAAALLLGMGLLWVLGLLRSTSRQSGPGPAFCRWH